MAASSCPAFDINGMPQDRVASSKAVVAFFMRTSK